MKYATRINSFLRTGQTLEGALSEIGRVEGVDYVDMNYPEHFAGIPVERVGEVLAANGLRLNAVNLRFRNEFLAGAFDNDDAALQEKAVRLCCEAAAACNQLGGQQCIIWLGFDGFDYSFQKDYVQGWNRLVACFRAVCRAVGCRVSVEYKPYEERAFAMIDSWGTAWKLIHDVNCENFGMTLDFCHMLMKKENPAYAAALLLSENRLFGIHVNDGEGSADDGLIMGSVHPWKTMELFYYLMKYDYQDVIYFDTFPRREDAAAECSLNRRICGAMEKKIAETGLERMARLIGRPDGATAAELMLAWMQ